MSNKLFRRTEQIVFNLKIMEKKMQFKYDIPESFYGLFRSPNRDTYIEALLIINEEYQYNSYYLSKESCIRILSEYFMQKKITMQREENETDLDILETPANRILNWLIKAAWLKKLEDYYAQVTNIVIPDYAAVLIEAFERLCSEDLDDTQIFIQSIYAILFSLKNDLKRANIGLLKTVLVNTRRLNKSLQDMLHNMDKFFSGLLDKEFYGELLKEHLDLYVGEIINKKYHILKTNDNFYIYKSDIKKLIRDMQSDTGFISTLCQKEHGEVSESEIYELLESIERGFDDIERKIANIDREHMKYVKATVVRLNYLLSGEENMKGCIIKLLNHMSNDADSDEKFKEAAQRVNFSKLYLISEKSLYRKRTKKRSFVEDLKPDEEREELSKEDILKLNKIHVKFNKIQIEQFLYENMSSDGNVYITDKTVKTDDDFEKLILAYDYSVKTNSEFIIEETQAEIIDNGSYIYPRLTFLRREEH